VVGSRVRRGPNWPPYYGNPVNTLVMIFILMHPKEHCILLGYSEQRKQQQQSTIKVLAITS
jgi:hypothetical protein